MAVSKRLRREVFRRDDSTCQNCGRRAPDVEITIDHVIPKALGGSDEPENLVTACADCNSGKSSASPDAPVVAKVAEDAKRWSAAMQAAAAETLAASEQLTDAHEHFAEVWARYGSGASRQPLPKDPGWRDTVDSLMAAGLPMEAIEESVVIAMGRRNVAEDAVFRYMCGVAWKKVTELQKRAKQIAGAEPADSDDDVSEAECAAIDNWCRIILGQRDARQVEVATTDSVRRTEDDSPSSVLWFVIHNLEAEREALHDGLLELMRALPGDIGVRLIRDQEGHWRDPGAALYQAAMHAVDYMLLARARQEMAIMPRDEYEMWVQRSRDENAEIAEHLSESYYVLDGARMAREAEAGAA